MDARLNVDVLSIISQFLTDYSNVLSFGLICSSLHPVANKRLLSMRPIPLTGDISVKKFHSFLFADPVTRAPHIRALSIAYTESPLQIENEEGNFTALLEAPLITTSPSSTLRSLSVGGSSPSAFDILLRNVSSPLRKLAVHSAYIRYPDALEEFLPRLAPTLQELELVYFSVCRGGQSALDDPLVFHAGGGQQHTFRTLSQYPAVRSLLVICFTGTPLVDRLQHLFPALDGTLSLGLFERMMDIYTPDAVREANQRTQEGSPAGAWKKFDRVVCDAPMLYALALRCPVRLVMLDEGSAETSHYAAAALRENPVPRLKLTLVCAWGMLAGIFTPELTRTLTHLTLCLVYDPINDSSSRTHVDADDSLAVRDDLLDTMRTAIRPLHNLTHLRIVINGKGYRLPGTAPSESPSSFVESVHRSTFDFTSTAASLVLALPSLQYVFLTTSGSLTSLRDDSKPEAAAAVRSQACESWNVSRSWRVDVAKPVPDGANPTGARYSRAVNADLVELHSDVAETIIRNEELVVSETDEAMLFSEEAQNDA